MRRLRVLWLSNKVQRGVDSGSTGGWLDEMARELLEGGRVELGNIAPGPVSRPERFDCGGLQQWVVPAGDMLGPAGMPRATVVDTVLSTAASFRPDLIHVWGTELPWGLLTARGLLRAPALLETQGLKGAIEEVYAGGLSLREQAACIGIKELVRRTPIWEGRKRFRRWAPFEREIIRGHRFVTAQTDWLEAQVRAVSPQAKIFRNDFLLRRPFGAARSWAVPEQPSIFCSAGYPSPFKGVHVAVRALEILSRTHPEVKLRVAGPFQRAGLRAEGYVSWLNRESRRLGVEDRIHWLGPLSAEKIVDEIRASSVLLVPTFVEGYCLALAEGMLIGAPAVVAYVGGTSGLARDEVSALFFPPGDAAMCAFQVDRILGDRALAEKLSRGAREVAVKRNDPNRILERQESIYHEMTAAG